MQGSIEGASIKSSLSWTKGKVWDIYIWGNSEIVFLFSHRFSSPNTFLKEDKKCQSRKMYHRFNSFTIQTKFCKKSKLKILSRFLQQFYNFLCLNRFRTVANHIDDHPQYHLILTYKQAFTCLVLIWFWFYLSSYSFILVCLSYDIQIIQMIREQPNQWNCVLIMHDISEWFSVE